MRMLANDIDCRNGFAEDPVIIVGTGPVGIRAVTEIKKLLPQQPIVIFGDEPWEPYDRIGLSSFLAGDLEREDLKNDVSFEGIVQHYNCRVESISRTNQYVIDEIGKRHYYSKLILATGSKPHIPNIPGVDLPNVFTFRDMMDVEKLFARRVKSRCTVVIGGGLLGLEAARAMQKHNTKVVLVEHSLRLMNKQLNDDLSDVLLKKVENLGINVYLQSSVNRIEGEIGVTGISLSSGDTINCDTVIVATGITPNKSLALSSGLSIGRGISVNDSLNTSDPNIFAIGECCEYKGQLYGLVAPGYEQAAIIAHILKNEKVKYAGSLNSSKLKVFGLSVYSAGEVGDETDNITNELYRYSDGDIKRVLVVRHRRIVGAMGIGTWFEFERIQEAIRNKRRVWPWQLLAFKSTGSIWNEADSFDVSAWPVNAIVCSCKNISRGKISECISRGCKNVESVAKETGASSVCGTCRPLVSSMFGQVEKLKPQWGFKALLLSSLLASIVFLIWMLVPPIPYAESVQDINLDVLWSDFLYKQISGYTLAGVTLLSIIFLSLRKRIKWFGIGRLGAWRNAHTYIGLFALILLILHTGLHAGSQLNFYLLFSFLLASIIGAASAYIIANEHKYSPLKIKRWRILVNRAHIFVVWPIPALLGFHITAAYYF